MSAAERMREACIKLLASKKRVVVEDDESWSGSTLNPYIDRWCEAIRSLPLPAPTPVEEAERRFMEACETSCRINLSGVTREGERAAEVVIKKYRALLAARQQEKEARDAP